MDESSLSPLISFIISVLVYALLNLAEAARLPSQLLPSSAKRFSAFPGFAFSLKMASVLACTISGLALVLALSSSGWLIIAFLALGLLLLLLLLDGAMLLIARRYPKGVGRLVNSLLRTQGPLGATGPNKVNGQGRYRLGDEGNPSERVFNDGGSGLVITEEEQSLLDARERFMIRSILRLDESATREVMVPRVDIVAVEVDTPLKDIAERLVDSGHTRLPVFNETIDKIVGVVHALDLLPLLTGDKDSPPLDSILRPAFFIPESKRLDELLQEFQEKQIQMAIVVDEYGGTEGLVTVEDLLEEIVGEIDDEFSRHVEPQAVPLANGDLLVDARITLSYLSDLFSTSIEKANVDTVGGLIYTSLGKIPTVGDEIVYDGLRIKVVSLVGRRIKRLQVTRLDKPA